MDSEGGDIAFAHTLAPWTPAKLTTVLIMWPEMGSPETQREPEDEKIHFLQGVSTNVSFFKNQK